MKFLITKTSDWDYKKIKEFTTLKELIDFKKEVKKDLILLNNDFLKRLKPEEVAADSLEQAIEMQSCDFTIEIYDQWRE